METSLGKLQCQVDKLSQKNMRLEDKNAEYKAENYQLRKRNEKKDQVIEDYKIKLSKSNDENKQLTQKVEELTVRIFQLEQRLNISSETSSLPPSQNPIWHKDTKIYDSRSQQKTTKTKGGQVGHKKNKLTRFSDDEVTETREYTIDTCTNCGSNSLTLVDVKERDELDFEVIVKKIRHRFYTYQCNDCGDTITTKIPLNLHAENQYGANVQTLGLALVDFGDVSYKRTVDIINGITNGEINPCESYLVKLSKRASKMLKNFIFDATEEIVHSKVVQHDDGVIKIGKTDKDKEDEFNEIIKKKKEELTNEDKKKLSEEIKKNFKGVIRAYTNGMIKLYKSHTNKSAETYKEDNILSRLSKETTVVHDHLLFNYNDKFDFKNAECNTHAIRKGRGIKANTNHEWPDKMADLLEGGNNERKELGKRGVKEFDTEYLNKLSSQYDNIVSGGFIECDRFPHKHEYADEKNLLEFFRDYKKEVLAWAYDWSIPFTNNLCETMIRLVKSKMKISYCFKSIEAAQYYADIISYTETCYNFGVNRYHAIFRLFQGNPYSIQELKDMIKTEDNDGENASTI